MNSQELWIKINMINIKGVNIKTCTRERKKQLYNYRILGIGLHYILKFQ